MRRSALILVILLLAACGVRTKVVMVDPAAPPSEAVLPDSVQVFVGSGSIMIGYEPVATISATSHTTGSGAPDREDVVIALREAAAGIGADAVILGDLLDHREDPRGDGNLPAEGEGTAIRLTPDPSERDLATAPRWLDAIGTVALAPVLRSDSPLPDSIGVEFDGDILYGLEAAGYRVVAPAVCDSIRLAYILEVDGIYDPVTGELYEDRLMYVERSTRLTLMDTYGVEGFVVPEIWPVRAAFQGTEAKWDGTSQDVVYVPDGLSGVLGLASAILGAFHTPCYEEEEDDDCEDDEPVVNRGWVEALSLMIRVENAIGADLYTGWGGIGVMQMVDSDGEPYEVAVLTEPGRNQEAVVIALEELGRRRRTHAPPPNP